MVNTEIYRLVLDESTDPIFSFYPDGTYSYVNNAFATPFKKTPDQIIGKRIWDIFDKDEAEKRFAVVRKVFESGELHEFEVRVPQELRDRYYLTTVKPVKDESGNVHTIICISKEITDRKYMEEELRSKNEELYELNATKDKFFSIIAHDLKNPISSFKQVLEMISDNYSQINEAEKVSLLLSLKHASKTLFLLLENLLTWSRSQRGIIKYNPESLPPTLIIQACVSLFKINADSKKISINYSVNSQSQINIDVTMMTTVLRNLISNAIKFTPYGGKIEIKVNEDFSKPGYCIFSVSDTGIGIPKENMQRLFSMDSTYTTPGTADEMGSGLGLILCREFIDKHHCEIWAESEVGLGSTFYFTVPISELQ